MGVLPAGRSGMAVPGFVDLQVNGFAGIDLTTADLDGYRTASEAIGRTGVTSFVATIPTAAPEAYGPALTVARAAVAADPARCARSSGCTSRDPSCRPTGRAPTDRTGCCHPTGRSAIAGSTRRRSWW